MRYHGCLCLSCKGWAAERHQEAPPLAVQYEKLVEMLFYIRRTAHHEHARETTDVITRALSQLGLTDDKPPDQPLNPYCEERLRYQGLRPRNQGKSLVLKEYARMKYFVR